MKAKYWACTPALWTEAWAGGRIVGVVSADGTENKDWVESVKRKLSRKLVFMIFVNIVNDKNNAVFANLKLAKLTKLKANKKTQNITNFRKLSR